MIVSRIVCAIFAAILFFSDSGEAGAQDVTYIRLKSCTEHTTDKDPTIVARKSVDARYECGDGRPVKVVLVDRWYGFETAAKTVRDVPSKPRRIAPASTDVFHTHKPCRIAYPDEGVLVEWLVPKSEECKGRDSGSYYRVYTPKNEVCIKPNGGCINVKELDAVAQERFQQTLRIAYQNLASAE